MKALVQLKLGIGSPKILRGKSLRTSLLQLENIGFSSGFRGREGNNFRIHVNGPSRHVFKQISGEIFQKTIPKYSYALDAANLDQPLDLLAIELLHPCNHIGPNLFHTLRLT